MHSVALATHQNTADHRYLECGRHDMKEHGRKQEGDAPLSDAQFSSAGEYCAQDNLLCTAVYCPRETSSIPRQMEADIEVEEMREYAARDSANSTLSYIRKDGIA